MELIFKAYIEPLNEIKELYGFNKDHIFLNDLDSPQIGVNIFKREDCVIMQSTGYKDKNGLKIYECDIIQFSESKYIITKENVRNFYEFGIIDNSEVIGNIHLII